MTPYPWLLLVLILSACASSRAPAASVPPPGAYDVSFIGIPFKASPLGKDSGADAVEITPDGNDDYSAIVLLTVEKELKGNLPDASPAAASKMDQASDALKNKQFLKVLLMDFDDPDETRTKEWISIAVVDPVKTFSVRRGTESERGRRYRVYLRQTGGGYHMIAAVPAS